MIHALQALVAVVFLLVGWEQLASAVDPVARDAQPIDDATKKDSSNGEVGGGGIKK